MRGLGGIYRRGSVYWIRYRHRGKQYRESTCSKERADGVRLLKQRLVDVSYGRPSGPTEERVTFDHIAADYVDERALKRVPPARLKWSKARVAHLKTFFGGMRAMEITTGAMRQYAKERRAAGAEPGTVNRDLGALSRMFTLALQSGKLSRRPYIPRLPENQPRQGFLEHADFLVIREHLPAHYRDVLDFGYLSGWRRGEILTLEWRDVDRPGGVIRMRPEVSKTREGRVLVLSAPLRDVLDRRWWSRALGCSLVFHRDGLTLEHNFEGPWRQARARQRACPGDCSMTYAAPPCGTWFARASRSAWPCKSAGTRRAPSSTATTS